MFLFSFFWASSHSSLAPTVEIEGICPPKGIGVLYPREIPFLNTPILLSSGAAVTWAHHAILAGKEKRAIYALVAIISLVLVFTGFQGMEYYQAPFTISDSIYGSTFFLATGFHGFHVIIGTLFLIIYGIRGIFLNRQNIHIMSMPIESMLLTVNSNFLVFSVSSDDMMGKSFASLVSTVEAAESAIGLAIFVITFRVRGTIAVEFINSIQGFIIFSRKSLGNTFKVTLDGRIRAIQDESQQFLNRNKVVPPESNEQ
ncbi:hypothetical protein RYX36_026074 [Vicia faba]